MRDLGVRRLALPQRWKAYAALALAQVLVGSSVVAGKVMIAGFPVFLASALRFVLASLLMLPFLVWREGALPRVARRDWLHLLLQALTGVFLFNVFLLYGLRWASAAASGIIISTAPALIGLLSFLFLGERLGRDQGWGIALAVLGVLALNITPQSDAGSRPLLGGLLVCGAAVGEALFTVFGKVLTRRLSALAISAVLCVLGLVMFLPLAVPEALTFDFKSAPLSAWIAIAYYAVFITLLATLLWFYGVAQVPASTAAAFLGLLPISAVLLAYLLLGEPFRWSDLAGGACVVAAIWFTTRAKAVAAQTAAQGNPSS